MDRKLARAELIDRLLSEMGFGDDSNAADSGFAQGFAQVILKRVDNKYLFKHRLTTLGAQLADSSNWVGEHIDTGTVKVRAFEPSIESNDYGLEGGIIETLMPDQPFVFDTLKLFMELESVRLRTSDSVSES